MLWLFILLSLVQAQNPLSRCVAGQVAPEDGLASPWDCGLGSSAPFEEGARCSFAQASCCSWLQPLPEAFIEEVRLIKLILSLHGEKEYRHLAKQVPPAAGASSGH